MVQKNTIIFASGCFWCTEAVFQQLNGVESVVSGYIGGEKPSPTYDQVSMGNTGHAEAIKVEYDSAVISLDVLLSVFFSTHDPTTRNRQGADVGSQYRSAIFYSSDEEKKVIESFIQQLETDKTFNNNIVTEVVPVQPFFPAETYHQSFYEQNKNYSYCQVVIEPKLAKLRGKFGAYLKI